MQQAKKLSNFQIMHIFCFTVRMDPSTEGMYMMSPYADFTYWVAEITGSISCQLEYHKNWERAAVQLTVQIDSTGCQSFL